MAKKIIYVFLWAILFCLFFLPIALYPTSLFQYIRCPELYTTKTTLFWFGLSMGSIIGDILCIYKIVFNIVGIIKIKRSPEKIEEERKAIEKRKVL